MLNDIDLSKVDLNLLVVFEVVMAEGHVGRAAGALHLTPSAVSHGLGRLRRLFDDPMFLRTPKGVVPTARALELAEPIADILARMRRVVGSVAPFDPRTTTRRFTLGAPDSVTAVILPRLLAELPGRAPGLDLNVVHSLPTDALSLLETRAVDIALAPLEEVPPRFAARPIYDEDFVVAARIGHSFLRSPTVKHYCAAKHILVSIVGDARGHVDMALAARGLTRRVALVAPNFMLALATVGETDLLAAIPRGLVTVHGDRFGVGCAELPFPLANPPLRAIVPQAALMDAGTAWLFGEVARVASAEPRRRKRSTRSTRRRA